ncbi:MAG: hypothetical protein A3G34_10830 [Candidatus Lindowbacteria bacterium RIFCSPLOWO2_12_FULL_62_27]|nr:MAG: hypothetical protein A3G34_10830 [Candidatus Lindowbacteria bacterium RIFCSPLOWO2_12_FULL_62_27]
MELARVFGRVWATAKDPKLEQTKLLLVQPVDFYLKDRGKPFIAVESVDAGAGEIVLLARGREATFPFGLEPKAPPVDKCCVGVVDDVYYDENA